MKTWHRQKHPQRTPWPGHSRNKSYEDGDDNYGNDDDHDHDSDVDHDHDSDDENDDHDHEHDNNDDQDHDSHVDHDHDSDDHGDHDDNDDDADHDSGGHGDHDGNTWAGGSLTHWLHAQASKHQPWLRYCLFKFDRVHFDNSDRFSKTSLDYQKLPIYLDHWWSFFVRNGQDYIYS